jgi:hypothetical protein
VCGGTVSCVVAAWGCVGSIADVTVGVTVGVAAVVVSAFCAAAICRSAAFFL